MTFFKSNVPSTNVHIRKAVHGIHMLENGRADLRKMPLQCQAMARKISITASCYDTYICFRCKLQNLDLARKQVRGAYLCMLCAREY
ncbi:hypothetical protein CEXT_485821 [Caerostris extrusa]|uniref:Uncharacterized protein n=1 Tax=Caerostris extrusa TaxID=172846 RepID=A0AAV4WJV7_CAEEX|nr:hypothetical protein CEXT_485821 [Caerostris extrusa]